MTYLNLSSIFSKDGILSGKLKNYEYRHQQVIMAEAVGNAIEESTHLIVEAGTGVGKSLAYLIPIILWAREENKKAIISTYTKALQYQLVDKDIPFLKDALGIDFSFALCVGGENYLCLRRLNQASHHGLFEIDETEALKRLYEWKDRTKTGLKSDMNFEPLPKLWKKVCREGDICFGKKCSYYEHCLYQKAKAVERKAHILVTNHYLFFAHIASGWNVLPKFDGIVFDEAHQLEDVAAGYLGMEVSNYRLKNLLDAISNPFTRKGLLSRLEWLAPYTSLEIDSLTGSVRSTGDKFFSILSGRLEGQTRRIREKNFIPNMLHDPLTELRDGLKSVLGMVKKEEEEKEVLSLIERCTALSSDITDIIEQRLPEHVYWAEIEGRRRSLFATPIDIAPILRSQIFENISPVILTSATLSIHGDFSFLKERLGLNNLSASPLGKHKAYNVDELSLDSPFNYRENVMVYTPRGVSDPKEAEAFKRDVIDSIRVILNITQGRTLILFTSYDMLNKSYNVITSRESGVGSQKIENTDCRIIFLRQGEMDSYKLVEEFKKSSHAVLLGTHTFWQGVDIPGDALQCVIIVRLPFQVPDDPVTEARLEKLKENGKDPFIHYQIPNAILMFKQGFGRLIRTQSDKGIVAILDPRVKTRFYGERFLSALPDCIRTDSIENIKEFFDKIK
ncbi:MAG: DEAD/DEAH box helicase [Nitrospinae bacterium]|nr:DEAD/DEAH box helicase [Nitrospinota bacterium]